MQRKYKENLVESLVNKSKKYKNLQELKKEMINHSFKGAYQF